MPPTQTSTRRTVLSVLGTAAAGLSLGTTVSARDRQTREYVFSQNDRCVPIEPIRGAEPVEAFYDYQLPEKYVSDENGASAGSEALYSSAGTTALQRPQTSIAFLYQGPDRLSLVLVHGSVDAGEDAEGGDSAGGSVSFDIRGLPKTGEWAVTDDLYRDPETGDIAGTNYDRWEVGGTEHTVDWTWGSGATDGGAFTGLGESFDVVIHPAFNDDAALYREQYGGIITDWTVVSGPLEDTERYSLSLADPLRIRTGRCETGEDDEETADGEVAAEAEEGPPYTVCHKPPGNPSNEKTIVVGSKSAQQAHLGHNDSDGACEE